MIDSWQNLGGAWQEFREEKKNVITETMQKGSGCLLVALLKNGQPISLLDRWTKEQLLHLRENESFFCPACRHEVVLKLGNQRAPHFAHRKEGGCAFEHEAESPYHAAGKADLFRWLQAQPVRVELEPYFRAIQQRPDLSVFERGRMYAVEYQCSIISEALFCKRNWQYKKAGIRPIWVLGAHHLARRSAHRFKLSRFQWLFAQDTFGASPQPFLFYYCPQTKRLTRLTNLISLSSHYAFSVPVMKKLSDLSFADLFSHPSVPLPPSFWHEWLEQKKRWRLTFPLYRNKRHQAVCADFYPSHLPSLFPPAAGWPLQHGYLLETPPFIWQTYILLFLEKEERASLSALYRWMKQKLKEKKIAVRYLPLAPTYHYTRAVYEYIELLEKLGYIQRTDRGTIAVIKKWAVPKTMEEALLEERRLLERIERKPL